MRSVVLSSVLFVFSVATAACSGGGGGDGTAGGGTTGTKPGCAESTNDAPSKKSPSPTAPGKSTGGTGGSSGTGGTGGTAGSGGSSGNGGGGTGDGDLDPSATEPLADPCASSTSKDSSSSGSKSSSSSSSDSDKSSATPSDKKKSMGETCSSSDECTDGYCLKLTTSDGQKINFCTRQCTKAADCPEDGWTCNLSPYTACVPSK